MRPRANSVRSLFTVILVTVNNPLQAQTIRDINHVIESVNVGFVQPRQSPDDSSQSDQSATATPAHSERLNSSVFPDESMEVVRLATHSDENVYPATNQLEAGRSAADSSSVAIEPEHKVDVRPPEVAPIFEQPGILTPRGGYVLEPAVQFGSSSSNRLTVVGYTIIPTFNNALVDVREVKRNATIASMTARRGITNRFEVEVKVPFVYRSDDVISRNGADGAVTDRVMQASGKALGDIELAARYQFNEGGPGRPYFVGGVRVKTRTGRDPFEVVTDCVSRCSGTSPTGTGELLSLPTGSGFYAVEPSLTWVMPADPTVLFGTFSYMHNFKRDNVSRTLLNGAKELLGEVSPGYSFGFNVGMGMALSDKASVSLGYDHILVSRPLQNDQPLPGSVRTQLGTIMVGYSYRVTENRTINVSIGAGLTHDAPDLSLMVRIPMSL